MMVMEEDLSALPELPTPGPVPSSAMLLSRETSETSQPSLTDSEFVDEMFTMFNQSEEEEATSFSAALNGPLEPLETTMSPEQLPAVMLKDCPSSSQQQISNQNSNRPDPELMKRLGDALELLPKETQEMIINRLIVAITSTDFLARVEPKQVAAAAKAAPTPVAADDGDDEEEASQPLPLAAATLAALLHHYSQQFEGKSHKNVQKTIPVIPVHA
jgi:hypothetical protein